MHKFMGKTGIVLVGWMMGSGIMWADQAPQEGILQDVGVTANQPPPGDNLSNFLGFGNSSRSKGAGKSFKLRSGSSKTSKKGKTKKRAVKSSRKSGTKKPRKSKSGKTRKKSKSLSEIDFSSEIG